MTFVLDHFLILTDEGAPQADLLSELGLVEGPRNDHPGQGTSNRRFFFQNAMLELAYVRDREEALNGPGRRLRVAERASDARASPFGVVLRASDGATDPPFRGWRYFPGYFGPDTHFLVGENSDTLEEPLCVLMPPNLPRSISSPPQSAGPFGLVSELRIGVPVRQPSDVLLSVGTVDRVTLTLGVPHSMEIVFDGEREGLSRDLRPALPLSLRW